MKVNKNGNDTDFNFISNESNSVKRPKDFAVINPVKMKNKNKIYKLQKSGSLTNKSVIDSVVMACKESDKKGSWCFSDNLQQKNSFHPVNNGLQQSSISGDTNGSSPESFPLNDDVMNKPISFCENSFDYKYKDSRNYTATQQQISYKVTNDEHVASKTFADSTKAFTNIQSGPLDSAEVYQKKKENSIGKSKKPCRKGRTSKISLKKKRVLPKNKCGHCDRKGQTIQQFECCDETAIATILVKRKEQNVPEIVTQEKKLLKTGEFGHAALPTTLADILSLKCSKAFRPVVPSSASPDIPSFKGPEKTVVDGNVGKQPKTKSVSVKSQTQKKRKGTYNQLNNDSPQMSQCQRYDQLVASPCQNTVDLSSKRQNSDMSTLGLSSKDKINVVTANLSVDSIQTDCKSKLISHKKDADISLLGWKNTSLDNILKPDQSTEDSNFSIEFVQQEICTKLRTPSKCVVVLPEELRESTDKSAALLSGNSLTTYKSEAIQNLGVVLSQKRSRDLSPANMSSVRLSKDVVSSPVHKSLQLSHVRNVNPNEKTRSVLAEWTQTGHFLLQTLNSASSAETVMEDQTSEANSNLNGSVFPFSVLFPNTTFSNCSEERSLSLIFDDEKAFDNPTPQMEISKACQGISMSEECGNSGAAAEGSVSRCLINSPNISGSFPPADDFRNPINSETSSGHMTKTSTTPAFHAKELPVRLCTQTLTEVAPGTTLISHNYEAALSLYLSSDEHSSNGDKYSSDESSASVGADPGNVDEDLSGCTNTYMMESKCLAGVKATSDSSQPEIISQAAQHNGACSNSLSPHDFSCKDKSLSSVATKKVPKYTSYSTTSKENKSSLNNQYISEETVSPSLSTNHCDPTIQKAEIQTKSVKEICKSLTASPAAVKNVEKIITSEYVNPKILQKPLKNLKHKNPNRTLNLHENGENCTTFLTNALVHAHTDQYCTPEKLRRLTHNPPVHTDSDQHCTPEKEHETPQNELVHANSDQHCTPDIGHESPNNELAHTHTDQHRTPIKEDENPLNELLNANSEPHSTVEKEQETPQNKIMHAHSDQHCTPVKEHKTPQDVLVHAHSDQHCTPVKEHKTPQDVLVHAHSNQNCIHEKLHNIPQTPLSSDTRSGIVLKSASMSTSDDLPTALNRHNPMMQTSLYPFRSCNDQESSSLYWFSEVATTYAYGAASSADLQRRDCVSENKLLTNVSKEIQESAKLASSSSNITKDLNTEPVNICDLATANSPSTDVTECNNTSPCNNHPIKKLSRNSVTSTLRAENGICEGDRIYGTGNSKKNIIPSNSLHYNKTEHQDMLHDSSTLRRPPSITALYISDDDDDDDCNFEGFQPSDMVKKVHSATDSFGHPKKIDIENPLFTLVASDENCPDAVITDGINRSSYKRTQISRRKRNLRGSSSADLVRKDRLRSIHILSPTKVTSRLLNEHTSSDMDNVKKGKVSSLELGRKIRFQKKLGKKITKTINPVRQIEVKSIKRAFPKSSILAPLAMNNANADVSPTPIPHRTITTSIAGSSELKRTCIKSSQAFIKHNIDTFAENQPTISNNKNVSVENFLHKSTNTSFDIQDHNENHIDTLPDKFLSDITCNKTAKGCTVRCRDPRSDPPGTPYECLTCSINNSFHSLVSLLQHIMVVHANALPASVGDSDCSSLMPADCVDIIASSPQGVESDPREANEQTPLVDSDCRKVGRIDEAYNGQRCNVDECSEAVDSGSERCTENYEILSSQPVASDSSPRRKDNAEVFTKSSENAVVIRKTHDHCDTVVKRSEAGIYNGHKKGMHIAERKRKETSDMNKWNSETGDIKRKKNKTIDINQRRRESVDANKNVNELVDVNITRNDAMNGKITNSRIYVNTENCKTFAVKSEISRSSDANSKRSVTLNCTKIKPINSTSNNTPLDNADRKQNFKLKSREGDHKCDGEQRSTKRKRRAGRKSKKVPCLPVKEEYKPPPIVMNPCRPRKGFILIPTMTPETVERLLSVQRRAFNDTFNMKRREIIAKNKEAGIDVSKQLVMVNGTKRYQCEKCTTSVSTVALLLNHMVTHYSSELAEFSCAFCPKTFRYGSALKLHLEKHGNIMRFFCPICKLGFQQEAKLRYHIMLHAQKKRTVFGCKKCDKKFNSTALLAGHSKVHYPDLKYRCRACDFVCIGRGGLSKHVKDEHRKKREKKD